jgi:hypothetical protein
MNGEAVMAMLRKLTILALVFGFVGTTGADTLDMDKMSPEESSARPMRGMSQDTVEQKFGIPEARQAAVGDPPISRWEYKDFVVFFEYDKVIHAVARRK